MTFKLLILFCSVFFLGKAQEVLKQPEFRIDENFMNLGPSTIHSVKGKLYEERQREIIPKHNSHNDNVAQSITDADFASQLQNVLTNISNTELQVQDEKILFRRNKGSSNDTTQSVPSIFKNQNDIKFDVPKKLQKPQANHSDSTMLFQAENLVSSYDKNKTIETIKKELAFDALLIKNDFNKLSMPPSSFMNTFTSQEVNPGADIVHEEPVLTRVNQPYRRLEINSNYEPVPPNSFQMPIQHEGSLINYGNNFPNDRNAGKSLSLGENNKLIMGGTFDQPITPRFEPTIYGHDVLNNINADTTSPLRQTNYNVIDKSICDDKESDESLERSGNDVQLKEPTKGHGISSVGKSQVMLIDHPRVCYACSSINDPSCWSPDRTTAVKYCRTGHPSCLTKFYKYRGLSYIIRDCGNTCEQNALAGGPTKYTSCTICHHDLCNSAYYIKIQNITILILLVFNLFFIERLC